MITKQNQEQVLALVVLIFICTKGKLIDELKEKDSKLKECQTAVRVVETELQCNRELLLVCF